MLKAALDHAQPNSIRHINTMLQYYGICSRPDKLTNLQWAESFAYLSMIREDELKQSLFTTKKK